MAVSQPSEGSVYRLVSLGVLFKQIRDKNGFERSRETGNVVEIHGSQPNGAAHLVAEKSALFGFKSGK